MAPEGLGWGAAVASVVGGADFGGALPTLVGGGWGPWSPFTMECSPQDNRCELEVLHVLA